MQKLARDYATLFGREKLEAAVQSLAFDAAGPRASELGPVLGALVVLDAYRAASDDAARLLGCGAAAGGAVNVLSDDWDRARFPTHGAWERARVAALAKVIALRDREAAAAAAAVPASPASPAHEAGGAAPDAPALRVGMQVEVKVMHRSQLGFVLRVYPWKVCRKPST